MFKYDYPMDGGVRYSQIRSLAQEITTVKTQEPAENKVDKVKAGQSLFFGKPMLRASFVNDLMDNRC
jgi:hypothetical protein